MKIYLPPSALTIKITAFGSQYAYLFRVSRINSDYFPKHQPTCLCNGDGMCLCK